MIVKAIERGVTEEKLAKALNVDIKRIKTKRTLLDGVCPEVARPSRRQRAPLIELILLPMLACAVRRAPHSTARRDRAACRGNGGVLSCCMQNWLD
jgi:hypothetical protein